MQQVVILAGGAGSRLRERLNGLPKPMVNVAGKPLLEHQILLAKSHCFSEIVILVSHGAQTIADYFGNGNRWGLSIRYVEDATPRGTAGAIFDAFDALSDQFLVIYGDTVLNVDLGRLCLAHQRNQADATLFLHPNDHPQDSDLVGLDENGRVTDFYPYPHNPQRYYANLVNAALYVIDKSSLEPYRTLTGVIDFGKHLFPEMLRDGAFLYGYRSPEYIKDAGTPDRLDQVESDIQSGFVEQRSMVTAAPAVFLDRDGTLNVEINRVASADDLNLIDGVTKPLCRLNRSRYRTVIVTNQPVIARGDCDEAELRNVHNKLETLLGRDGAYVDAIYYCPHHPHGGYEGERPELKIVCSCRKPAPGLVFQAAEDLNIDLRKSWLIGDSTTDIMTARAAGLKSVLVRTGHAGRDGQYPARANFEFPSFSSAVDFILRGYPRMYDRVQPMTNRYTGGERVIVSGLAHTGKSTWSSTLQSALMDRGLNCVVVSLDNWLRNGDSRESGGVLSRYDMPAIDEFVKRLSDSTKSREYTIPYYERYSQMSQTNGDTLTIGPDDIVIFDGVIGLLVPALTRCASHRIFVECSVQLRRRNFWTEYRLRGYSETRIAQLFNERESEETATIRPTRALADLIVEGCLE